MQKPVFWCGDFPCRPEQGHKTLPLPKRPDRPSIYPRIFKYPRGAFLVNNEEEIFWVIKNYRLQLEPTPIVGCEKPPLEGIQELALQAGESEVAVVYLLSF
ncbi:hypothetical protein RF11_00878 [Thelohanellus kitauei]|uniref:Uncharacterized protein n=1 Tax=Thelohanellus kitauei TaxID=669202 RepID=A0A0C2JDQ6_THEKT|nr:hypothetical protein RF11_00878 [Thelohanellus kitauei]